MAWSQKDTPQPVEHPFRRSGSDHLFSLLKLNALRDFLTGREEPVPDLTRDSAQDLRARTNVGVSLAVTITLSPFMVFHIAKGNSLLATGIAAIVVLAALNAYFILKGRMVTWLAPVALVPAIISFLVVSFHQQGVIAAFWSYPPLIGFHFILSSRQARVANLAFLAVIIPAAARSLPAPLAIRVAATLIVVSILSAIFVCILSRQRALLRKMAATDQLTGFFNRSILGPAMEMSVHQSRRSRTPLTLVTIDLDRFKSINDTLGHDAGDSVLEALGETLRGRLRASDQIFRLGGEEFLVALFNTDSPQGVHVAEDLRARIAGLSILNPRRVTASFGVATLRPEEDWTACLKRADERLYCAKYAGRNRVVAEGSIAPGPAFRYSAAR